MIRLEIMLKRVRMRFHILHEAIDRVVNPDYRAQHTEHDESNHRYLLQQSEIACVTIEHIVEPRGEHEHNDDDAQRTDEGKNVAEVGNHAGDQDAANTEKQHTNNRGSSANAVSEGRWPTRSPQVLCAQKDAADAQYCSLACALCSIATDVKSTRQVRLTIRAANSAIPVF